MYRFVVLVSWLMTYHVVRTEQHHAYIRVSMHEIINQSNIMRCNKNIFYRRFIIDIFMSYRRSEHN